MSDRAPTPQSTAPVPAPSPASPDSNPPTSPAVAEDLSLSLVSLKASREHTHATQRAKKAGDRAKGRRGARGAEKESTDTYNHNHPTTVEKRAVWEAWADAKDDGAAGVTRAERGARRESALGPVQVRLLDLVRPSKTRARAKKGGKNGDDFEVVPHVRSVIVLDDAAEPEPEEPWEYVSSESEEEGKRALSYAQIVSKAT